VVDLAFAKLAQVVAAAEALSCAFHHDHVDGLAGIGPFHRRADFAWCVVIDRVVGLGPV
jgi:hypothetical protein